MSRMRRFVTVGAASAIGLTIALQPVTSPAAASKIRFSTPTVVDPVHTFGEPDVGIDPLGRAFVSGPTGTGTQRSMWLGSVDGGATFRPINPGPPPSALSGTIDPPGGGDTDIAFDRSGTQYFSDLYALICLRTAVTRDGGATVSQSVYPAGCAGVPGADRQWLAVFDPPGSTTSPYTGPRPLIYMEYNDLTTGAQWVKSTDGLDYVNAEVDGPGKVTGYAPFGADGYPSIDQITGAVFQAEYSGSRILLNIGTPNAAGDLTFLDAPDAAHPSGDPSKLITVATGVENTADDAANFVVTSMDAARNLYVAWVGKSTTPALRQTYVSVGSAASGWRQWSPPVRVSSAPSMVSVFPWVRAGGPGRADVVWYGSNKTEDPSTKAGQAWDVYMAQVVYPTTNGAPAGQPSVMQVKVTPHPMHYQDICLAGSGCIASQGNRNLADFFVVTVDRTGAAEVVYDDTSNGLVQPGFTPANQELVDHSGAGVVTLARQSSGAGLFGTSVSGRSKAPTTSMTDASGDALYPVLGGTSQAGYDLTGAGARLTANGAFLDVSMSVADLSSLSTALGAVTGATSLHYVTRWQMGNRIYYAAMQNTVANVPIFYAGAAQSVDLCSVSACFPHVITYPEPGFGGSTESGFVSCPAVPSASDPCTVTIHVKVADVGGPTSANLLEEVGAYAFASSHPMGATTNAQAEADNVPLEIDGVCCFNDRS